MRFKCHSKKHDFEENNFSEKHDFECKFFSKKHDFECKIFRKEQDFELKFFRLVSFRINLFTTCKLWNQIFHTASDFKEEQFT